MHCSVRHKKLDRINFRSGKRGRVLRNPPGVTTGQWVSRVVGHLRGHMILCHMILTRPSNIVDIRCSAVNVCPSRCNIYERSAVVSVLPPGIDVRKLQR